ncbi:acyl carrier protein [Streptomyces sp. FH025]|uniref:acyl carrier protein n=1 Tax=Streptomyces sp. FH025 TaxID=2815937 RepID=UPI001A9F7F67|nr:acyl carrier protein [Streptomyces sp. FH025]MBO1413054.1 acyl carrier protein [Streptomyces sp. FH025]
MSAELIVAEALGQLLGLEPEEVALDAPLHDLENWDSVNQMRVLVYLERETGQPLDYDRFMDAETAGAIAALVAHPGGVAA